MNKIQQVTSHTKLFRQLCTDKTVKLPNNLWVKIVPNGSAVVYSKFMDEEGIFLNVAIWPNLKVRIHYGQKLITWIKCNPLQSPSDVTTILNSLDKVSSWS